MDDVSKEAIEKAKDWLNTKEGQESLKKSLQEAAENSRKFTEARYIDPKILREPFTI